ncbi:MAG TPA: ABC transporter substrate-binding protein, partial [bacterium]|nr:ABC transporter substrate-binding protein [bacterium]
NPYNDISYQNPNVDALIEAGKRVNNPEDAAPMWRALQAILHEDQPATFLYWRDELVGYNQKIKNSRTSLLGEIDKFWLWEKVTN